MCIRDRVSTQSTWDQIENEKVEVANDEVTKMDLRSGDEETLNNNPPTVAEDDLKRQTTPRQQDEIDNLPSSGSEDNVSDSAGEGESPLAEEETTGKLPAEEMNNQMNQNEIEEEDEEAEEEKDAEKSFQTTSSITETPESHRPSITPLDRVTNFGVGLLHKTRSLTPQDIESDLFNATSSFDQDMEHPHWSIRRSFSENDLQDVLENQRNPIEFFEGYELQIAQDLKEHVFRVASTYQESLNFLKSSQTEGQVTTTLTDDLADQLQISYDEANLPERLKLYKSFASNLLFMRKDILKGDTPSARSSKFLYRAIMQRIYHHNLFKLLRESSAQVFRNSYLLLSALLKFSDTFTAREHFEFLVQFAERALYIQALTLTEQIISFLKAKIRNEDVDEGSLVKLKAVEEHLQNTKTQVPLSHASVTLLPSCLGCRKPLRLSDIDGCSKCGLEMGICSMTLQLMRVKDLSRCNLCNLYFSYKDHGSSPLCPFCKIGRLVYKLSLIHI
eukprot:TRINITY_DN3279_c0_g1_i5.p1 TRINITY_DN3279_c0_g1~~TRINITY_DN3279_c0_g1_i5.p1  ORF type:complete len:522 (+),score=75.89 TRINITY_DN3279_c0_g1_i5:60-1568(+)